MGGPAQPPMWRAGDRAAVMTVSRDVYSRRAVLCAAYKLSDRYVVFVDGDGPDRWAIFFVAVEGALEPGGVFAGFSKELVDQALREQLEQEFGAVRHLIVAQAFSEGNLLDGEPPAPGDHSNA